MANHNTRTAEEPQFQHHVPAWLIPLLGEREKAILCHRDTKFLHEDLDGNRYPNHQQWIESPVGNMLIDAKKRQIIG